MSQSAASTSNELVACHHCDCLHRRGPSALRGVARCRRCGAVLYRHRPHGIARSLSLYLTALALLILTNSFPFMGFELSGQVRQAHLITGTLELFQQGYWPLGLLVTLTITVIPTVQVLGYLAILWPLHHGRTPSYGAWLFRWMRAIRPWAMIEVYVLGVLVALVKLASYATVIPGVALFSLGGLMLALAGATASLDPDNVWRRLDRHP